MQREIYIYYELFVSINLTKIWFSTQNENKLLTANFSLDISCQCK